MFIAMAPREVHRGLQEQLMKRISELEGENKKLQETVEARDADIKRLQQEKDAQKKASDAEVCAAHERAHGLLGSRGCMPLCYAAIIVWPWRGLSKARSEADWMDRWLRHALSVRLKKQTNWKH
jgi:hypothetical protein